jgi:AcrR family transcriptional regulator
MTTDARLPTGLRGRKKARTRVLIQEVALRLFHERGYAATTVGQIAAAADVSERTFFRYFPTKADTVLYDRVHPRLIEAFLGEPAELPPLAAFRAAYRSVYARHSAHDAAVERQRQQLISEVEELDAITAVNIRSRMAALAEALSRRTGLPSDDPRVRAWVGAISGVSLAAYLAWASDPARRSISELVDEGLVLLEAGLPL